jgi:uncharacterized membrane protein YfcA
VSIPLIAFLTVTVFVTSAISGVFGMAGGLILMTVLLALMPLQAAMTFHAAIQIVSNGSRCLLWRKHIVWHVLPWYGCGIVAGFCLMLLVHYVPDKGLTMVTMGILPLVAMVAGKFIRLSITNRVDTFLTATILTFVQMTAGVVGPLLDLLYNSAPLTRQQIIGTKAFTQFTMHLVRMIYFGSMIPILMGKSGWPEGVDPTVIPVFLVASIAGTSAAAFIVHHLNDRNFRQIGRLLIAVISIYCVCKGFWMLMPETH